MDANVFLTALVAGIAALVIVSLLTPPEPAAKTESFFGRLETSSDDETPGKPLLLVNLLRLGRAAGGRGLAAYKEDLGGFGIAWVLVIVLVIATMLFLGM